MTINETLTLNLDEEIKNVIDLEDTNEEAILQEIESYIVTEGISKHLLEFTDKFTSNIRETGVWVSGFYGSGKSYFGKMLGYIIDNPTILGTPARDRFITRVKGVKNESFLESNIRSLDAINSRVIFMDIAKQNTDKSLAFTLFTNFLKSFGFRDDNFGYMEFDLYLDGKLDEVKQKSLELFSKPWDELKYSNLQIAMAMRKIYAAMGYSESDYEQTLKVYNDAIDNFSATKLKEELEKYLTKYKNETIVFIFDEASEAISQGKFSLLDLEGISESLSSISNKVWTIAIAQEKLDDVINNANVSKSQLIKVTDRFKTKLHLESTEVDVIIKSRLLHKKEEYKTKLLEFHKQNDGQISEATNLKSSFPTKTADAEEFATYYPFHKYHFSMLQKFLFSSNALVASQIAARGVIFTTFNVLKKHLKDKELFTFSTLFDLCDEAQVSPPTELSLKYDTAKKILADKSEIDGQRLLKVIHFLNNSADLAIATVENITKGYMSDLKSYYDVKPKIEEALAVLLEAKVLIHANNNYKITSDLESKLLEEMNNFTVELYLKKRDFTNYLKKISLFSQIASINDDGTPYNFNILTDADDDIKASANKNLRLTLCSLYALDTNLEGFIEGIKLTTQYTKELMTLIPQNKRFDECDRLLSDVRKYNLMIEKYDNDTDEKIKQIIREFSIIKDEKEKNLIALLESAYSEGALIYMYETLLLSKESFKSSINDTQRKLIKNIYTKRLQTQLSEAIIPKLLSENSHDKLSRNFSGDDFKFFDTNGNFIGEHLKVVEEITAKIKNATDGKSLEMELGNAPWGYSFGTIATTLAALFKAGRVIVRFNSTEYFSPNDRASHEAFVNTTKFKSASFKAISKSLTTAQKTSLVQALQELEYEEHTAKKIGYNSSDFDLADAIKILSEHFITAIATLKNSVADFDRLFASTVNQKQFLQEYTSKTTESNYIDKVVLFLENIANYDDAINQILKTQKFIKNNFSKIKELKEFMSLLENELTKCHKQNTKIAENKVEFESLYKEDIVKNHAKLMQLAQESKDEYFKLLKESVEHMTKNYSELLQQIGFAQEELNKYPPELNAQNQSKLTQLKSYAQSKIIKTDDVAIDFHVECKKCNYSLSDVLNYIEMAPSKRNDLVVLQLNFVKEAPLPPKPMPDIPHAKLNEETPTPPKPKEPKKISFKMSKKVMSIGEYKELLSNQL
jgi:hypothetical protein